MKVDNINFEVGNARICITKAGADISTDNVFVNGELIDTVKAEDISSEPCEINGEVAINIINADEIEKLLNQAKNAIEQLQDAMSKLNQMQYQVEPKFVVER